MGGKGGVGGVTLYGGGGLRFLGPSVDEAGTTPRAEQYPLPLTMRRLAEEEEASVQHPRDKLKKERVEAVVEQYPAEQNRSLLSRTVPC